MPDSRSYRPGRTSGVDDDVTRGGRPTNSGGSVPRPEPPPEDVPEDDSRGDGTGILYSNARLFVQLPDTTPLRGVEVTYTSKHLFGALGVSQTGGVTDATGEVLFRVVEHLDGLAGQLVVRYGGQVLFSGAASELLEVSERGVYTGVFSYDIAIPDTWSAENPTAVVLTPTATSLNGGVLLRWNDPGEEYRYRIYAAFESGLVVSTLVGSTFERYFLLKNLWPGETVHVLVRAENVTGTLSASTATTSFVYTLPDSAQIGIRGMMPQSVTVAQGQSTTVDLRNYLRLATLGGSSSWSTVTTEVLVEGGPVTAEMTDDYTLTLTAGAGAGAGVTEIVVGFRRLGHPTMWMGLCAWVGASTGPVDAYSYGFASAATMPEGLVLALEALVGADAEIVTVTDPRRQWRVLAHDTVHEELTLQPTANRDGVPEVALISGAEGYGLVVLGTDPIFTIANTPYLPSGTITKAEAGASWMTVDFTSLMASQAALRNISWRRVLVGTTDLYSTYTDRPPAAVHYAAPSYFDRYWWDRALYPADAALVTDKVIYRGGLETTTATPTPPDIEDIGVTIQAESALVTFSMLNPETSASFDQQLALPVYVRRGAGNPIVWQATGGAVRLEGLVPGTAYTVRIGSDTGGSPSVSFTTEAARAVLVVDGVFLDAAKYRYTYTLTNPSGDAITGWTDPFGEDQTELTLTVERPEMVIEHSIAIEHTSGRTYGLRAATQWVTPPPSTALSKTLTIGRVLPASGTTQPQFGQASYAGSASATLPANVYKPGQYIAVADGGLMPGMTGELEDYVTVTFVSPLGQELGPVVTLELATELAIKITVTAANGLSPLVYGVHVVRQ